MVAPSAGTARRLVLVSVYMPVGLVSAGLAGTSSLLLLLLLNLG
jgi:hypothetical protein